MFCTVRPLLIALCVGALASSAAAPFAAAQGSGPMSNSPPPTLGGSVSPAEEIGTRNGAPLYRKQTLSPVYTVDQIFKSMMGPATTREFTLEDGPPELLWITGYEAVMKQPDGEADASDEFMCHSNLDVDGSAYRKHYPSQLYASPRLFTLSQGQLAIEFPEGFGIPIRSSEKLSLTTQVLNHNVHGGEPFGVRHEVSLDFVRDADLEKPLTPLIPRSAQAMVLVEGNHPYFAISKEELDEKIHGPGCLVRDHAGEDNEVSIDRYDQKFTGFWYVPPGRHVNHSQATKLLALPYDTNAHYIAVHLHPFAESLELRDVTTGETVFKSKTRQAGKGIGLEEVEYYSSVDGLPVHADHEYELITIYNNTSGEQQDSMAVMHLYLHAKDLYDFDFRPRPKHTQGSGPKESPAASR